MPPLSGRELRPAGFDRILNGVGSFADEGRQFALCGAVEVA
ncbi:MAG TPA: hypothetical protein VG168_02595 [Bryobacteraceae bacterium]|nr:hypothetical protein [Bryobacteraceae bacterium]